MVAGVSTRVGKLNPRENKGEEIVVSFVKVCETFLCCSRDAVGDVIDYLWEGERARGGL